MESHYACDICIEGCKLFSHLCQKFCGLIGEFGVELVEFLIHIFHCAVFLQSFQGAAKIKTITGHHNGVKTLLRTECPSNMDVNHPNGQVPNGGRTHMVGQKRPRNTCRSFLVIQVV